jgi:hypothetical protein
VNARAGREGKREMAGRGKFEFVGPEDAGGRGKI